MEQDHQYEDHNFYLRFIISQHEWKTKMMKQYNVDTKNLSQLEKLYQFSIINAAGIRAAGATTAVAQIFDPSKDLYVGINSNGCAEFEKMIISRMRGSNEEYDADNKFSYLNFNSLTFDNTNLEVNDIADKIESFFGSNSLEVMKVDHLYSEPSKKMCTKLKQIDLSSIKREIAKNIIDEDDNRNFTSFFSNLVLKRRDISDIVVYIDIGTQNHREYSIRVNRLIHYIYNRFPSSNSIMFVLT